MSQHELLVKYNEMLAIKSDVEKNMQRALDMVDGNLENFTVEMLEAYKQHLLYKLDVTNEIACASELREDFTLQDSYNLLLDYNSIIHELKRIAFITKESLL